MTPNSERLELPLPGCETCSPRLQQWHPGTANTQLAAIVTASADAIVSVAPDGKFLSWNPGAEKMFGYSTAEAVGRSSSELIVPPSLRAEHQALLAEARAGSQMAIRDTARCHKDGTLIEVEISASPICDAKGEVKSIAAIYRDVSDRKRDERRQRMLMSGLSHRSKNLFSVINSITRLSLASATSIETAKDSLIGRLEALQRTYSKLSNSKGRIEIAWRLDRAAASDHFTLSWVEAGGPPVLPPEQSGFGTTVIEAMPRMELDAEVTLIYAPEGLCWRLECPAERVLETPSGFEAVREASAERKL